MRDNENNAFLSFQAFGESSLVLFHHDLFLGSIQRYSVVPLSTNSGLIGWVPNCDTLHALIRDYREKKKILLNIEHRIMLRVSLAKWRAQPVRSDLSKTLHSEWFKQNLLFFWQHAVNTLFFAWRASRFVSISFTHASILSKQQVTSNVCKKRNYIERFHRLAIVRFLLLWQSQMCFAQNTK